MGGRPIWFELMTTDADAVRDFYRSVVGWEIPPSGHPVGTGAMDYRMIQRSDGGAAGGVLTLSHGMIEGGARPGWLAYFEVDDVPAACARLEELGGSVHMPPRTIDVGTMAMVSDPQSAPFYVMDPVPPADQPDAQSDVWDAKKPQHCRWVELATTDAQGAREFYQALFGWEFRDVMPMGEVGDYLFIDQGDLRIGAINPMIREGQPPIWLLYFGVLEIDAAFEAAKANGGTIQWGPHPVPGGDHIFVTTDPTGAMVAFVGPKGE